MYLSRHYTNINVFGKTGGDTMDSILKQAERQEVSELLPMVKNTDDFAKIAFLVWQNGYTAGVTAEKAENQKKPA